MESVTMNLGLFSITFNGGNVTMSFYTFILLLFIIYITGRHLIPFLYRRHCAEKVKRESPRYCPECKALTMLKVDDTYDTETNSIPVYVYECPACGCNKEIPHDC